jgi:predicted metal-dependent phosphoesterase TrpH
MNPTNPLLCCDFHIHTEYSPDCRTSIDDLIEGCIRAGLNCIAVTDHDEIEGAFETQKRAPFKVVIGEEVSSQGGHIIGLFLKRKIPPGLSVKETIARIKEQGGVAIAPHPFALLAEDSLQADFLKHHSLFDAVEVANSNNLFRWDDRKARRFAEQNSMLKISGSDAHRAYGLGANRIYMQDFSCPSSFLQSLEHAELKNRVHSARYIASVGFCVVLEKCQKAFSSRKRASAGPQGLHLTQERR